jgi:hypothetical protein
MSPSPLARPRRHSIRSTATDVNHAKAQQPCARHPRKSSRGFCVAFCGKCDELLQGGNRGPVPCAGRTGLSPAYEQRSAKRRRPTGRRAVGPSASPRCRSPRGLDSPPRECCCRSREGPIAARPLSFVEGVGHGPVGPAREDRTSTDHGLPWGQGLKATPQMAVSAVERCGYKRRTFRYLRPIRTPVCG